MSRGGGNGDGGGTQADAPEPDAEEPCEPFDPPVVYDCPFTEVDYTDGETRDFLRDAMQTGFVDMHAFEDFLAQAGHDTVQMRGFPGSFMCASIELNLFRPDTTR